MSEKKKPQEIDQTVLEYVKAAISSSDRARAVLIVMITASVLVFTAYWNTGGWLDARLALRTAALNYFVEGFDPATVPEDKRDLYERAKTLISVYGWDTKNGEHRRLLVEQVTQLGKVQSEQFRTIHVPFFGVVFDMNDLGIFAGITFCVALLWLRLSLTREHRNLQIAFEEADERGRVKLCYELLSMHQVLTVPPMPGHRYRKVWSTISKFLHITPALVYLVQFQSDWGSRHFGYLLNRKSMDNLLIVEAILFSFILIFTYQCLRLYITIDKEWDKAFAKVYPQVSGGGGAPAGGSPAGDKILPEGGQSRA